MSMMKCTESHRNLIKTGNDNYGGIYVSLRAGTIESGNRK